MEKLRMYWHAKPYVITQKWGIYNPAYEQFGFNRHNGEDCELGADGMLYAPVEGEIVYTGNVPTGSGIHFYLMTDYMKFDDGNFRVCLVLMHCEELYVKPGDKVSIGQKLAKADNTGFSTGPHTHIAPIRVAFWNGEVGDKFIYAKKDTNDANGTFDPSPYWTGYYAVDYPKLIGYYQALILLLKKLLGSQ